MIKEYLTQVVSLVSAIIALLAYRRSGKVANEQRMFAERTYHLSGRGLIAKHHAEYSKLLYSIQNDLEKEIEKLSDTARKILSKIAGDI